MHPRPVFLHKLPLQWCLRLQLGIHQAPHLLARILKPLVRLQPGIHQASYLYARNYEPAPRRKSTDELIGTPPTASIRSLPFRLGSRGPFRKKPFCNMVSEKVMGALFMSSFLVYHGEFFEVLRERDWPGFALYANPPGFALYANPPGFAFYANNPGFSPYANNHGFAPYANRSPLVPYANRPQFPPYANPPQFSTYAPRISPYANPPRISPYANPLRVAPNVKTHVLDLDSDDEWYDSAADSEDSVDSDDDSGSDAIEYGDDGGEACLSKCGTQQVDLCSKKMEHSARISPICKNSASSLVSTVKKSMQNDEEVEEGQQRDEKDQQLDEQKPIAYPPRLLWKEPYNIIYRVNIDGHLSKHGYGGYAAIVRDHKGKAIVAAAGSSGRPVPRLYLDLQGVKRGLELALKYGCPRVEVCTDSLYVSRIAGNKPSLDGMNFHKESELDSVVPILEEIIKLKSEFILFYTSYFPREYNRAAIYLAKMGAKIGVEREEIEFHPEKFPKQLQKIVHEDANEGARFYAQRNFRFFE
ncbi:hypothetical protein BVC80_8223g13 [Macleaya cordata]|uniref:RNase H type-1 domain-containing protein n=1 Tax=Macleaya cordata TaxID=56857 RepID=A0A200QFA8_MACCD|nr:hypothetical protein BVC80_8223g13 [Macleaya cordata]